MSEDDWPAPEVTTAWLKGHQAPGPGQPDSVGQIEARLIQEWTRFRSMPDRDIELVAMVSSGERFVVRGNGALWLVPPPGYGVAVQGVTQDFVEQAIVKHGWNRIERTFESWVALETARQQYVLAQPQPDWLAIARSELTAKIDLSKAEVLLAIKDVDHRVQHVEDRVQRLEAGVQRIEDGLGVNNDLIKQLLLQTHRSG